MVALAHSRVTGQSAIASFNLDKTAEEMALEDTYHVGHHMAAKLIVTLFGSIKLRYDAGLRVLDQRDLKAAEIGSADIGGATKARVHP
jgi:hypothetical protein